MDPQKYFQRNVKFYEGMSGLYFDCMTPTRIRWEYITHTYTSIQSHLYSSMIPKWSTDKGNLISGELVVTTQYGYDSIALVLSCKPHYSRNYAHAHIRVTADAAAAARPLALASRLSIVRCRYFKNSLNNWNSTYISYLQWNHTLNC